ncbi:MAG: GNAT family N-acetyltransferase [Lachnospiraceae bacterium]
MSMNIEIKEASLYDVPQVIALIQKRIVWMDKENLDQWNKVGYLEQYSAAYFNQLAKEHQLFLAEQNHAVVGAMALLRHDTRWSDDVKAVYIHHLVSDPGIRGVGKSLIGFAEVYAKENQLDAVRLDSQKGNHVLDKYYDSLGYPIVGLCVEALYTGYKREKSMRISGEVIK